MPDGVEAIFHGLTELKTAMDKLVVEATGAARNAVAETAHLVEFQAKQNATSRPGPMVRTGYLRRSIIVKGPVRTGVAWTALVGPTAVYGRRVELGFNSMDSLGRQFNQPPYPYLGPAYDYVRRFIPSIFAKNLRAAGVAK